MISRAIAAPGFAPPGVVFVAVGALKIELMLALPVMEALLVDVVFPGPTKKKVAPRRVRFPVLLTKVERLKFVRLAGTVPLTTVTLFVAWRYIATTYRWGMEPFGGVGPTKGMMGAVWLLRMKRVLFVMFGET